MTTAEEPRPPEAAAPPDDLNVRLVTNTLALDRGELARLKRNAGSSLAEARDCLWFYRVVPPPLRANTAEHCFLVATLMANATRWLRRRQTAAADGQQPEPAPKETAEEKPAEKTKRPRTFGAAMARLKQERSAGAATEEGPVDRRFSILLDAYLEIQPDGSLGGDLPFRLRQMVRMADASDVTIDWAQLLRDLRNWNDPGKRVQKAWARDFYDPRSQSEAAASNSDSTPDPDNGDPDAS